MRLITIIIVASLMQVSAATLGQRITITQDRMSLKSAFKEIRKQSGFDFYYEGGIISNNQLKDLNLRNVTVDEALRTVLKDLPLTYVIENKNITIRKAGSNFLRNLVTSFRAINVRGKIVDENDQPLIGATVGLKGKGRSVKTDQNGAFYMENVAEDDKLVISYIGYELMEVNAAPDMGSIKLVRTTSDLNEVVVVGYGTMQKKDLTGSVTQIIPDRIANENPKTVQDILRGTPGLRVGYNPSAKGGGEIEIRGRRSVYDEGGHNSPLLILDGMIFYGELSEINPDDIAQIDILKDASAAAIYGAKAASGVIIITTKKGKPGKPVINMTMNVGSTGLSDYRDRFDTEAYLQHRQDWFTKNTYGLNPATNVYEAYQTGVYASQPGFFMRPDQLPSSISLDTWRGYTENQADQSDLNIWAQRLGLVGNALQNFLDGKTVDWADRTFRTGFNQDYNASVSGAGDRINYYLSMGYLRNQGVVVSDDYRSVRSNMKIDAKVNNWLELGANVNFQDRSDGNVDIDIDQSLRNSPFADYYDETGNPGQFPLNEKYSQRGYNYDFQKQYLELEKGYTVVNTILNANVKLPLGITYSFNFSPRYQNFYDRYFMSANLPGSDPATRGANREQSKSLNWSLNNTLAWDHTFKKKHHVILTLVQEAEQNRFWRDRIEARKILPSDVLGFHNTKNGSKENSTFSSEDNEQSADGLLARLFYSYDDRYLITTSVRRDGYSAFGTSNPYAVFPSMAVAWSFTNEKFFKWGHIMNSGKLRVSYGENGNRSLANPYIALSNLSEGGGKMQGYLNSAGEQILYRYLMADRLANPFLQWEKTASWNFGLDFGFLGNRLTGSLEYYNMKTHDMIMKERLPSFTGFTNITTNLGRVDNSGIEFALNTVNMRRNAFEWSSTFGFSYNKNKITHLYYDYEDVLDANGNVIGRREMDDQPNGWFIDRPIGVIWDYRVTGIWQANEAEEAKKYGQVPGDPKVANSYTADDEINADGTAKPVYNNKDKEFLGETSPPYRWSLRNDFSLWKDLSVSFNIYAYTGHKSLFGEYLNNDDDGGRMAYALINLPRKAYWTPENPTNEFGRIEAKGPVGAAGAQRLYDRSFVRLDNVSVAYTLPSKWTSRWDLNRVRVYGTVRNVATWTKEWTYGDPETQSPDNGQGWATRVFTLGLNLVF
ncbi:SusC/RagA family TonB-linked outer membrane protein [Pedobacter faecalis]|uniref:SusC/RagA family TonB-linked outer membrane protein n=1 Tax=Pedobacter faecalis TaxID=3041495 RepID=UPI00254E6146|nr:SusC/RagA family TonB-linked outer membrane protein [Pedobacter sp. ELA7]